MKLPKTYEEVMNPYDMWAEPRISTMKLEVWNTLARAADGRFYIVVPGRFGGFGGFTTYRMWYERGCQPSAYTIANNLPLNDNYVQINKWIKEFTCEA